MTIWIVYCNRYKQTKLTSKLTISPKLQLIELSKGIHSSSINTHHCHIWIETEEARESPSEGTSRNHERYNRSNWSVRKGFNTTLSSLINALMFPGRMSTKFWSNTMRPFLNNMNRLRVTNIHRLIASYTLRDRLILRNSWNKWILHGH